MAAVALAAGAPAAASAADVEFRATVSPDSVVFGETAALTYRVEMKTGAQPERFEVAAGAAPAFGDQGALLSLGEGTRLEGPGTVAGPLVHHADAFPCSQSELRERHGALPNGARFHLELPAQTTSTLVFEGRVASMAPWPGDRYAIALSSSNASDGTLEAPGAIPVAAPPPGGRTGVRLEIEVAPTSARICSDVPPRIDREPITISGRSDPPLEGQQVLLRYVPPGERGAVTLASVPVAADGTFSYAGWRPQEPGVYEVAAEYVSQRPELTDDFSLPRVFELGVPAGEAPPRTEDRAAIPPEPFVWTKPPPTVKPHPSILSRRLTLGRRVRVRLACQALPGSECLGVLRIVSRGRVVAHRRVRMRPGTRGSVAVRLRLRARDRRTLRRRGRLVVTAHAGAAARRVIIRP